MDAAAPLEGELAMVAGTRKGKGAVVALCLPQARFVTGEAIHVDGGSTTFDAVRPASRRIGGAGA